MEESEGDALESAHVDDPGSTPLSVISPDVIQDGSLGILAVDRASSALGHERIGGHMAKTPRRV